MYCNVCNKYRKFKKSRISSIFKKTVSLSIVCSKYGHEYSWIEEIIERRRLNWYIKNSWFN